MSPNPISLAIVVVLAGLGVLLIGLAGLVVPGALLIVLALIVFAALKMARQWEQAVVLGAGKRRPNPCSSSGESGELPYCSAG
jgi:hypothetical protein